MMKRLTIEKRGPLIIGLVFAFAWWRIGPPFPTDASDVLSAALTLGAILTGFLATSKAFLLSLNGTQVMGDLRSSGYLNDLVFYLATAIWTAFAFCILTIAAFFLDVHTTWFGPAWFGLGIWASLQFVLVTVLTLRILRHAHGATPPR